MTQQSTGTAIQTVFIPCSPMVEQPSHAAKALEETTPLRTPALLKHLYFFSPLLTPSRYYLSPVYIPLHSSVLVDGSCMR